MKTIEKMIINNRILIFFILLGLAIRLLLAFLPGFQIDVNDWFAWALRLSHFNFANFYSKDVFTDYTPGYLYVLSLLGFIKNSLGLQDNLFYILLKIPAIIADLTIGLLVYKEIRSLISQKIALLALILTLFNPALIFNSSVWGQIDSILTLLLLISVITVKKNYLILSSIFFVLALLVKPQALALAPLFILFLVNHLNLSNFFKLILPGLLTIFILTFPFFPHQTLINLILHITNTANEYPYTSLNAYNLWGILGFWISDKQYWHHLSYQTWGYILFVCYWGIIGYFYFKKKLSLYTLATLATLGFFFLPTRIHERYLYPAIIFLILSASLLKTRLLLILTVILSLIHLLNLYYVYIYYNHTYLNLPNILYNPALYNFLAANNKSLSLLSVLIFILISITALKYESISKKS